MFSKYIGNVLPFFILLFRFCWFHINWFYTYSIKKQEYSEEAKSYLIRKNIGIKLTQWDMMNENEKNMYFNKQLWIKSKAAVSRCNMVLIHKIKIFIVLAVLRRCGWRVHIGGSTLGRHIFELRRNVAAVARRSRPCVRFDLPENHRLPSPIATSLPFHQPTSLS